MSIFGFTKRIFKEQPLRFSLAVFMLLVASLLEGAGIALLVPLLQMISGKGGAPVQGRAAELTTSFFSFFGLPVGLESVLLLFLLVILSYQGIILAQQKVAFGTQFRLEGDLREKLYDAIFNARWPFFVDTRIGYITNALSTEVVRCGQALSVLNALLTGILISFIYLLLAFYISWQSSLVISAGSFFVFLLLSRKTKQGKILGEDTTKANTAFQDEITEQLSAAKLIKGYAAQDLVISRFRKFYNTLAHTMYLADFSNAKIRSFMESGMTIMLVLTVYVAFTYFSVALTGLMVFLFIFYRLAPRISNAQASAHRLNTLIPSLDKIDELVSRAVSMREANGTLQLKEFKKGISFEDVSFSYVEGHPVLSEVDITITKGKTVAVVGSSGVGKSTIVDLALGIINPSAGKVLLDGVPIAEYDLRDWKKRIGYVAQDTVLFNDTVEANIGWALPASTRDDVIRAAKMAYAHDFINELPQGYETIIGTRGVKLSGGQRQRLALARALIRKPEFLILDEATSALDAVSEKKIQKAVEELASSVTILLVTHRLATIRNADFIYLLEEGKVVENGSWDDLTKSPTKFNELRKLQMLD